MIHIKGAHTEEKLQINTQMETESWNKEAEGKTGDFHCNPMLNAAFMRIVKRTPKQEFL